MAGWAGWAGCRVCIVGGACKKWLSFGEEVRVRVRVIGLGLESGSESRSGLEPHFSVAGSCTADQARREVAQREFV